MSEALPRQDETARAPQACRDAAAELVQIGMSVARMVGRAAEAETALAEAAMQIHVAGEVPALADTLAEAIEADRAIAAAFEARHTVVARAEVIAAAFARVSRAVRLTILLVERLERGWAKRGPSDDRRAIARRQIARGVEDAIGREAEGERAERLSEALSDRLESLDVENELADWPAEKIIRKICRDLGLDQTPMTPHPPLRDAARPAAEAEAVPLVSRGFEWEAGPPHLPPDG